MIAITYYFSSIKNEFLKLKRTFAFWLTIASAFFIPGLFLLIYLFKTKEFIPAEGVNPWNRFLFDQIRNAVPFLLPMFLILLTSLIIQIEHKSNTLKHLFTLPIPKWSVYFGKLSIVVFAIFSAFTLFYLVMIATGFFLGFIHPELKFTDFTPDYLKSIKTLFRTFIAVLGITGLQFWLSFRIKNFIIPLGIGIVLMITGIIIYRGEEAIYFPYSYNVMAIFTKEGLDSLLWFPKISFYSLGYFLFFAIAGYIDISRKNIK